MWIFPILETRTKQFIDGSGPADEYLNDTLNIGPSSKSVEVGKKAARASCSLQYTYTKSFCITLPVSYLY